jgi:hypothetical protein
MKESEVTPKKAMKVKGVYGSVFCSITFLDSHPFSLNISQHRKGSDGEEEFHSISILKEDMEALVEMMKANNLL